MPNIEHKLKGLWQDPDPVPPWQWRKDKHESRIYVGNFPEFADRW